MLELKPTRSNGFGIVGVTWTELKAWSEMVKRPLEGHEALMLHRLSAEYADMVNDASKTNCPPPYVIDVEASRSAASIQLGKILDAMIAERNKK